MTAPLRPLYHGAFALLVALLVALLPSTRTAHAAPHPAPAPPSHPRAAGVAGDVLAGVNRHRQAAGCRPVRAQAALNRSAHAHSLDMAGHQRLQHPGSDGSGPLERMRAHGFRAAYAGEAIARGADGAAAVVELWMDSPSHHDLILTCRFTHAGVGRAEGPGGPWWTLDLASKR
ncbi:CAP domain-containing protein [Streptomyces sp. NPDC016845]|uniref:CAP domain-containing protein n=1 Tax=Streptomyces sp. NPDC016845 TaxID=3364972 RepID=UPI003792E27E